jgi:hypothetical protein
MLVYLQMIETPLEQSKFEVLYRQYRDLMFYVADQILQQVARQASYRAADAYECNIQAQKQVQKVQQADGNEQQKCSLPTLMLGIQLFLCLVKLFLRCCGTLFQLYGVCYEQLVTKDAKLFAILITRSAFSANRHIINFLPGKITTLYS